MQTTTVWKPRGLQDLNFDILLQVVSLLTPRQVAHLTRTCHALRRALAAELPRERVSLEGRHLTSFLAFTDVKNGRDRLEYFQELELPGSTYETMSSGDQVMSVKDVKRALSTILHSASNLRSLTILDLNTFSFLPKELKAILDSFLRLGELEMSGIQKKYGGILVDVLPRLHTLGLDFLEECDPNTYLKTTQRQNGLRNVTLYGTTLKGVSLCFPSVHTLRACPMNLPSDVDALTHIFPNVKHVVLDLVRDCSDLDPEYRKSERRRHHGVASLAWTHFDATGWRDRLLARPRRKADAWPDIQSLLVMGFGVDKMGWLGLTCRVPRVEVSSWRMRHNLLAAMLKELGPRCVVFHPGTIHGPWLNLLYGWHLLSALESSPSVTRLAVALCKYAMGVACKHAEWLGLVCGYVAKSSVSFFLLRLADCEGPVDEGLSDQLGTWSAALSDKVRSLKVFIFQIEGEVHLGWVKKPGGWVQMTADEARELVASEDVCPSSIEPCEKCESSF